MAFHSKDARRGLHRFHLLQPLFLVVWLWSLWSSSCGPCRKTVFWSFESNMLVCLSQFSVIPFKSHVCLCMHGTWDCHHAYHHHHHHNHSIIFCTVSRTCAAKYFFGLLLKMHRGQLEEKPASQLAYRSHPDTKGKRAVKQLQKSVKRQKKNIFLPLLSLHSLILHLSHFRNYFVQKKKTLDRSFAGNSLEKRRAALLLSILFISVGKMHFFHKMPRVYVHQSAPSLHNRYYCNFM